MERTLAPQQCLFGSVHAARRPGCFAPSSTGRTQRRSFRSSRQTRSRRVTTMGLFGLGLPEVAVVAGIAVLVFGPSKLPELGKELGKTVKSFQTAAKEFETELKTASEDAVDSVEDKVEQAKDEVRKQ